MENLIPILKTAILNDIFYGVSVEAANTLGAYSKVKDDKDEKIKKKLIMY